MVTGSGAGSVASQSLIHSGKESHLFEASELMPAFLNGSVVTAEYEQGYFVGSFNGTNSSFGMEPITKIAALGVLPTSYPAPKATIEPTWGLIPYFGPSTNPADPAYHPAKYGIQTMCAPATVSICYGHPQSVFLPGVGVVPLPGHDHLANTTANNKVIWWQVWGILVFNKSYWPGLTGSHGITSMTALAAAQAAGAASASIPTNIFADFAILKNGQSNGGSPDSPTLAAVETMPVFFGGTTHTQSLEQTYWTGSSAKFQPTYGMEPLMPYAEVGTPPFFVPTTGAIGTFYSLVPWFGPAGAPFEPAYNPAKYGIQLMCAPANITLCWDHPETIFEPGIGTVPLPGHDHLVGTLANHVLIWWNLKVVLVYNQSYWPPLDGSSGISSVAALEAAQDAGAASSALPTNVFFEFAMA
jgi:hypothetical protein